MKDELKSKIEDELKERFGKATDKLRQAIAIHQLKKGKLVTNVGSVHTRKKLYRKVVFNNLGEEFTIMRASNLGWRDKGELVTSRGISQLDYFSNNGIYNGIAKASKELLHVFDFVDLVSYMSGNGKPGIIPTPFPALDFVMSLLVAQASANLNEMWEGAIDALVEAAKDQGISGIHKLKLTRGGIDKRYDFTEISQEMLNQLLKGEIRTLNQLRNLKRAQEKKDEDAFYAAGDKPYTSSLIYTVLHHKEMDENRSDFVDVVDCIFI